MQTDLFEWSQPKQLNSEELHVILVHWLKKKKISRITSQGLIKCISTSHFLTHTSVVFLSTIRFSVLITFHQHEILYGSINTPIIVGFKPRLFSSDDMPLTYDCKH